MLKRIKTEVDYSAALKRLYELMQTNIKERSADSDELEILSLLVEKYELVHYPVTNPPINSANNIQFSKSNSK